jgi:hypothetical protein
MKRILNFSKIGVICLLSLAAFSVSTTGFAQLSKSSASKNAVSYSLPRTVVKLIVKAEHESYAAGPYAKYAKKYIGADVRTESGNTYTIKSIELAPYVEPDPSINLSINISTTSAADNFLNICDKGLIIYSDTNDEQNAKWNSTSSAADEIPTQSATSNLASTTTTLYKSVQTAEGIKGIPVEQTQVVEKSDEKKAEETAALIIKMRQKRMDIITGETDVNYDGQAMKAILAEIDRLEKEYLIQFTGKSVKDTVSSVFYVKPDLSNSKQLYMAFRISDSQGLLPAGNLGGRPIILEITSEGEPIIYKTPGSVGNPGKGILLYRKPVTVMMKLLDGQKTLLQSRMPVYQFGEILSFPVDSRKIKIF